MWFLCYFCHRHLAFRKAEVQALWEVCSGSNEQLEWREPFGGHEDSPFWSVNLPNEDIARRIAERAILARGFFEVWGEGKTQDEVRERIEAFPSERKDPYVQPGSTFKLIVDGFGRSFTSEEALNRMAEFSSLPLRGTVKLSNPENKFWIIESVGTEVVNNGLPQFSEKRMYFAREVAFGDRAVCTRYALKYRRFLGPTSMDCTGSILIAAAHYGSHTIGADIDIRILRDGRGDNNIWTNFRDYGLNAPLGIIRCDNSMPAFRHNMRGVFDAIICDPPYGVRAGGRKSGGRKILKGQKEAYTVPEEMKFNHIPSTAPYTLAECLHDLLDLAARSLVMQGRLVYMLPAPVEEYTDVDVPVHACFELLHNCEQLVSSKWSRRLITMRKVREYTSEMAAAAAAAKKAFKAASRVSQGGNGNGINGCVVAGNTYFSLL
eukprot:jgi/Chlat1/9123/Chrsp97S00709